MNILIGNNKYLMVGGKILSTSTGSTSQQNSTALVASGLSNINLWTHGQSNAGFFDISDGATLLTAQCVSYWLGATGTPGTPDTILSGSGTQAGTGVYCGVSGFGSYLIYGGDTVAAAQSAVYSSAGAGMINYINTLTNNQKAAVKCIIVDHGETDSVFAGTGYAGSGGLGYTDKSVYKAALKNDFTQIRAAFNQTASELPIAIFGVTYGTFQGYSMVREAWAELAADPTNNLIWALEQTGDDIVRGNNWNSSTGLVTVGSPNSGHVDSHTNLMFAGRASLAIARSILSSNGITEADIPAVFGSGTGPKISSAHLSGNIITCTVVHDAGTDIIIPLLASLGVGFCVMDGGSISSPGNLILATTVTRIDPTHFSITLTSTPTNTAANCRLFYPIQGEPTNSNQPLQLIGMGCAITDNFSTILLNDGITLPSVVGSAWNGNYPLCSPMTLTGSGSSTTATFGMVLS